MPNPNLAGGDAAIPPSRRRSRLTVVEGALEAALAAQRSGQFDEMLRQHPRSARGLVRRFEGIVRGAGGEAFDGGDGGTAVAGVVLRWLVGQLRPDAEPGLDAIDPPAWLNQTAWRPMLAVACHAGLLAVPPFPERYRRRADEPALDNLCGLWGVGTSTFYRYQERGKRAMALRLLDGPGAAAQRLALRRVALASARLRQSDQVGTNGWHRRQSARALARRDPMSALWHAWQASDDAAFVDLLRTQAASLAGEPETEALVERMAARALAPRVEFDLWMARAALARTRSQPERELLALDRALQTAQVAGDRMLIGIAYGAIGKFHEPRDAHRAFACYQDSVDFLRDLDPAQGDPFVVEQFVTTLTRLAWLYVLRNDERGRSVLDRAEAVRQSTGVPDHVQGMLDQTWGEYWRRAEQPERSLEHRYRALNTFERVGDRRSIVATLLNLVQGHGEARQFDRAIELAARVFDEARKGPVEPALLVSTHLNLGATHFWQSRLDDAVAEYTQALAISQEADLRLHAFRARYNLAEAHYHRFLKLADPQDEQLGDAYVAAALAAPASDSSPAAIESARQLKHEVLGGPVFASATSAPAGTQPDRLLPDESAVHFEPMAEIRRQRAALAVPGSPASRVRAHLTIAQAYLSISTTEREQAQALIERHALQGQFAEGFERLRAAFERTLTREQRLAAQWKAATADWLDDDRRATLAAHLLDQGQIGKSGYAALCGVSPATASKHLSMLAAAGLLRQTGRGPATRYLLPPED